MQSVLKFGGAALADDVALRRSLGRVQEHLEHSQSRAPVVVVSALAGVTDGLMTCAEQAVDGVSPHATSGAASHLRIRHRSVLSQLGLSSELLDRHWRNLCSLLVGIARQGRLKPANLDLVLSYGERMSARIFAAALERSGVEATPVDAWDVGLVSDSNHGQASPVEGIQELMRQALLAIPGVPVVTGFLAQDRRGQLTTLGRNGSDLTASLLAEAIGADELVFYKDVIGVHSADPRRIADAFPLGEVSYAEAAELAFHGSTILHPASVAPAVRAQVPVRLLPLGAHGSQLGTVLVPRMQREAPVALACRSQGSVLPELAVPRGWATLALVGHGLAARGEFSARAQSILDAIGIDTRPIQCAGRLHSLALAVEDENLDGACQVLHREILLPSLAAV